MPAITQPLLHARVAIPAELLADATHRGAALRYGGDIRIGDLDGDGEVEYLVYRCTGDAHDGGGNKPCFMAAFTESGEVLWTDGEGGGQPLRPGPVAVYDIDGDGAAEIVTFYKDSAIDAPGDALADVVLQVRDGRTGKVLRQAAPAEITTFRGRGPNVAHQRILVANLRGGERALDFIVKLGERVVAFTDQLEVSWTYRIPWNEYSRCSAYIPSVGDVDGDGRDEINGGYYLLDDEGSVLWEKQLGRNMDSVAITAWDGGRVRAICSGYGHVMGASGNVLLRLGEELVPHGQEVRVARFDAGDAEPQMVIRHQGHTTDVIVVDTTGEVRNRFQLNPSPNNTGMEIVYWNGLDAPAMLYNGGMLWQPLTGEGVALPDLPPPTGPARMGWYHCIPADVCGDAREDVVLYNPWDRFIYVYTPAPYDADDDNRYRPGPRQYNPRLMD